MEASLESTQNDVDLLLIKIPIWFKCGKKN